MTNDEPYLLVAEQVYRKQAKKFFPKHPDVRPTYERLLADLAANPFAPALRLHPLTGVLKGKWAVSLTYAYRITLTLRISEKRTLLLDIGSHDAIYR